jgi:hypothetical protein
MSVISRDLIREEVAAAVCAALERAGIPVVLSGGSVVSIYSDNEYESYDLDFIRTGLARKVDARAADQAGRPRWRREALTLLGQASCSYHPSGRQTCARTRAGSLAAQAARRGPRVQAPRSAPSPQAPSARHT